MTESEAKEMLEAYMECDRQKNEVVYEKQCHEDCDNCELCYAQGTVGEHKEAVNMAIKALEKQIPKKTILQRSDEKSLYKCPCCDRIFVEAYDNVQRGYIPKFCEMCGQAISFRLEE